MRPKLKLTAAAVLAAGTTVSAQTLYSTSFEEPTYFAGMSVVGIDGWAGGSGSGDSQTVSSAMASQGNQSLFWDNNSFLSFYSVSRELPPLFDLVSASVDLWIPSGNGPNRLYGIYFTNSPTATMGGTVLGVSIGGDGSIRGGTAWSMTYGNSGLFHTADPGSYTDRWITLTLSLDPATGDGAVIVSGLDGATPSVSAQFSGVNAALGLNLGTDWFTTTDHFGTAYMDNLVIEQVPGLTGACCLPSGACEELRELACLAQNGTYHGDETTCATTPPGGCPQPPTGACCLDGGSCVIEWEQGCLALNGLYRGDGTDCSAPCPLSITSGFDGTSNATGDGAGAFFNITAVDPAGITIDGFAINTPAAAGTPLSVHVYARPGTFFGYESDFAAWTLVGEAQTYSAGQGNRTPVSVGGLEIGPSETWGMRVGVTGPGGIRYSSNALTQPIHSNGQVELEMGRVQTGFFTGSLFGNYPDDRRGWNGTVYYSLGANVVTGACCYPDGSCAEVRQIVCDAIGGHYHGDNTTCAGVPQCPEPGACCITGQPCSIRLETACLAANGTFQGSGTDCVGSICPGWFIEGPDAGELPFDAAMVDGNGALFGIEGNIDPAGGDTVDLYMIRICDYQNFSATTVDGATWDTILSLYNEAGYGVALNVDDPLGTTLQSRLSSQFVTSDGIYYLGISRWNRYPADASQQEIWTASPYRAERAPDGAGAGNPLESWLNAPTGAAGAYTIFLTGACFLDLTPPCYADCDANEVLNIDDFLCFINEFAQAQLLPISQQITHYANCDGSTHIPVLTVDDFLCFINEFAQGCP